MSKLSYLLHHVKTKEGSTVRSARPDGRRRRQRAEARHSIAAILDAATTVLRERPGASVEDIARAAGVTRQTVYAHFGSRDALLTAVTERAASEVAAAFEAAGTEDAPPAIALARLLDVGWEVAARYPFMWLQPAVGPEEDAARHGPVLDRMLEIVKRGQRSGDFDGSVSAEWLLTAGLAVGRAAEEEVRAGRMTIEEASDAVRNSFLRLFGIRAQG
ncbi:MAG: TetR/AcrR family transcriptional regulator [Actinobacteria bacterium]|nr:TetR/AcrR family transcriptional regulator [Actinomycetota bacterium]